MSVRQLTFQAIGTHWSIHVYTDISSTDWSELQAHMQDYIGAFDATYSRFRPDSLVTTMSQKAGEFPLPPDGFALLNFYEQLYAATDGLVTPLIGQALSDAGYDANYSFHSSPLDPPPKWEDVFEYSHAAITLKKPALLDFGAAGKGYLVDIIGGMLRSAGVKDFTIDASGDILHRSPSGKTIAVGMENPNDTSEAIGVIQLGNQSICASAGSRRKWGAYHHIINPVTLQSPTDIIATWVIANDTMTADGLTTALFFVEPQKLVRQFDFGYAILHTTMSLEHSKDFPAEIFQTGSK